MKRIATALMTTAMLMVATFAPAQSAAASDNNRNDRYDYYSSNYNYNWNYNRNYLSNVYGRHYDRDEKRHNKRRHIGNRDYFRRHGYGDDFFRGGYYDRHDNKLLLCRELDTRGRNDVLLCVEL